MKMEPIEKPSFSQTPRPACFGDEAKFVSYMETASSESACASCPSADDCGEFILIKCSQELIF